MNSFCLFATINIEGRESNTSQQKKDNNINIKSHNYKTSGYVHGRWFSPGIPASSTTKTGCHDIAEILLKVALNTIKQTNLFV
jgi:hypothetical protein